MVRDCINYNHFNINFRPKEFPIALKKIGSFIGRIKNTLSNFQKEVSAVTEDIDLEEKVQKNNKIKKDLDKNGR